ncbi:MAG: cell division protein FtsL [Gammaproteobacteria bacterium]|jgi:cell division protein FtsL
MRATAGRPGMVRRLADPRLAMAVLFLALVGSAMSVVWTAHRIRTLTGELERLHDAQDTLLEERGRLLLEHSAFAALTRVEAVATEDLGMKTPSQDEMEFVRAP